MGRNAVEATGAKGRKDALAFDPETIVLVTDKSHPLYDERVDALLDIVGLLRRLTPGDQRRVFRAVGAIMVDPKITERFSAMSILEGFR